MPYRSPTPLEAMPLLLIYSSLKSPDPVNRDGWYPPSLVIVSRCRAFAAKLTHSHCRSNGLPARLGLLSPLNCASMPRAGKRIHEGGRVTFVLTLWSCKQSRTCTCRWCVFDHPAAATPPPGIILSTSGSPEPGATTRRQPVPPLPSNTQRSRAPGPSSARPLPFPLIRRSAGSMPPTATTVAWIGAESATGVGREAQ